MPAQGSRSWEERDGKGKGGGTTKRESQLPPYCFSGAWEYPGPNRGRILALSYSSQVIPNKAVRTTPICLCADFIRWRRVQETRMGGAGNFRLTDDPPRKGKGCVLCHLGLCPLLWATSPAARKLDLGNDSSS